jgi:hypothetical protein
VVTRTHKHGPPGLTFKSSVFCPHSTFMCSVYISDQTVIISLYTLNCLAFITDTECAYCAVRALSHIVQVNICACLMINKLIHNVRCKWNLSVSACQHFLCSENEIYILRVKQTLLHSVLRLNIFLLLCQREQQINHALRRPHHFPLQLE